MAKIVGINCAMQAHLDTQVRMWVFEEIVDGRKLTEIINTEHENVKYLKGISLPTNVEAVADIAEACKDANILIFVLPHQFLAGLCDKIKPVVAPDCIGVSLIKGVHFDDSGMVLISEIISKEMGGMDVSVLMGANLANEVAAGDFSESTIGYNNEAHGKLLQSVFNDPRFQISIVNDVPGVEVCGAVKNVVALGAGFIDGMGGGDNSKAAIIRIGLMEMKKFIQTHYPKVQDSTFFESCGVADLIVTCYGGRNRKCAEAFVRAAGTKTFEQVEAELLNGQKIQGTGTAQEVMTILRKNGSENEYPLLTSIYKISFENAPVESMLDTLGAYGRLPSQAA
eukprot:Tamp_10894.p1 GENE.Tamp_10894~~Tamp_10894.p1  ORF type:complete len:369 (-),score=110.18 Tamp_10894:876-1892(-)